VRIGIGGKLRIIVGDSEGETSEGEGSLEGIEVEEDKLEGIGVEESVKFPFIVKFHDRNEGMADHWGFELKGAIPRGPSVTTALNEID
jgi:hypothetical protein